MTAPNTRWSQFHLSSLLLAQFAAALIVLLNFVLEGYCSNGWRYFGWPFKSFATRLWGWSESRIIWDAMFANVLIWLTLVIGALKTPDVLKRLKFANEQSIREIWHRFTLNKSAWVLILVFLITQVETPICLWVLKGRADFEFGWPYVCWGTHYGNWCFYGYRALVIDVYMLAICIFLSRILFRFIRKLKVKLYDPNI